MEVTTVVKKTAEEKRAEAERAVTWPKRFTWNGVKIVITDPEDWSAELLRNFEQGHAMSAIHDIVGPGVWEQIKSRPAREMNELADTIAKKAGFESTGE